MPLGSNEVDFYGAESAVGGGVRRVVAQGVLVANIAGDLNADRVDVFEASREEGQAARGFGQFGEVFGRFANHSLLVLAVVVAEDADGINHGVGIDGGFQRIGETLAAGVVVAVGDDQQDAFIFVAFLQVVEGGDDGVVQGGAAARIDFLQSFVQFLLVAGEILIEIEVILVVKVDHENFVGGVAGADEGKRRGVHLRAFVLHARAVIDDQTHRDRNVFGGEDRDFLLRPCLRRPGNYPGSGRERIDLCCRPPSRAARPGRRWI